MAEADPRDEDRTPTAGPGGPVPGSAPASLGPYKILGEIGRGGMGVVYKAFHPELGRTVALKVLVAGEDASEEAVARFRREASAVARLGHHPNIVPVYEIGQDGRRHYFAMHFVEGRPLDRSIDEGALRPREAARIALKIAEALQHAHGHGILHRDVKPANILLAETGGQIPNPRPQIPTKSQIPNPNAEPETPFQVPLLTDFGLAKDVASETRLTRSGMTLGTPQYMAPEQARGDLDAMDERSDVYALGATLYEMLVQRPPFDGAHVMEVVHQILFRDPAPLRRGNPALPRDLETICLKCLEKDPGRRYETAAALAQDLERHLEGVPILARPVSALERLVKRARRNRALTAALAAVVALGIAAAVGGALLAGRLSSAREDTEKARKDEAKARLEYRRAEKANEVVLGAALRLQEVRARLQDAPAVLAMRQAAYREAEPDIRAFAAGVPDDDASRAALLGVQGWLLFLGGFGDEARAAFAASRALAPDLPWGTLFEAAAVLTQVLARQPMPDVRVEQGTLSLGPLPAETPEAAAERRHLEGLVQALAGLTQLDAKLREHLAALTEGLAAFFAGDLGAAERGLSRALEFPYFGWVRDAVRLARARVRYLDLRFDESLAELEALAADRPRWGAAQHYLAGALLAVASVKRADGEPVRRELERAVQALDAELAREDTGGTARALRGVALDELGRELEDAGEDPLETYRKAKADLDVAVGRRPGDPLVLRSRAALGRDLGKAEGRRGADPLSFFRAAADDYSEARRLDPGAVHWLAAEGELHLEIGKAERALDRYPEEPVRRALEAAEAALRARPRDAKAHRVRAGALFLAAEGALKQKRDPREALDRALRACRASLDVDPAWTDLRNTLAATLALFADHVAARGPGAEEAHLAVVQEYSRVLEADPSDRIALANRGLRHLILAETGLRRRRDVSALLDKAEEDCTRALALHPGYAMALFNRAETRALRARIAEAKGLDAVPGFEAALADYAGAVAADRRNIGAHVNGGVACIDLGRVLAAQGRDPRPAYEKGLAIFEAVTDLIPRHPIPFINRATLHEKLALEAEARNEDPRAQFRRAVELLDAALERDPDSGQVRRTRGFTAQRLARAEGLRGGDPAPWLERSVADLRAAAQAEPADVQAQGALARSLMALGRLEEARGVLERALEHAAEGRAALEALLEQVKEEIANRPR